METTENQRQLPGTAVGLIRACKRVEDSLIDKCQNARQAMSLCIRLSGFTDERVAEALGISKGYLSKVLNGRASLDGDRRIRLMLVCGNLAPAQYEAKRMGMYLSADDRAIRRAALQAELEALAA